MLTVAPGKAPTGQSSSVYKLQYRGREAEDCQAVLMAMLVEFMRKGETAESAVQRNVTAQDQLFTMLLEERKLTELHGAKHPEVIELRQRIDVARRMIVLPPSAWKSNADPATAIDPVKLHVELLKQKLHH